MKANDKYSTFEDYAVYTANKRVFLFASCKSNAVELFKETIRDDSIAKNPSWEWSR